MLIHAVLSGTTAGDRIVRGPQGTAEGRTTTASKNVLASVADAFKKLYLSETKASSDG